MVKTIIVDDDFDTVEVFQEFLELKGIQVIGKAYDGLDGVKLYEKLKPDVLFCDVMMPTHDGFFLLESIKKNNPNAKIVMITADLSSDTEKKLLHLKADAIIYKPFEMDNVMKLIDSLQEGLEITQMD